MRPRIIPVLLLKNGGLVKSISFENYKYIGDPINAVKIFNDKEADELILFDIDASKNNSRPNFNFIEEIASECFMPLGYGGGIKDIEDIKKIFSIGIEKVVINSKALIDLNIINDASKIFGSQSIVVSIDVKKNFWGKYYIFDHKNSKIFSSIDLIEFINDCQMANVGELIITSVDKDGRMEGYDLELINTIESITRVPVVFCGGAGKLEHFQKAIKSGASALAAGSKFIYHGPHNAVLINYFDNDTILSIEQG